MANQRRPRGSGGISYDSERGQYLITWPVKGGRPGRERVEGSRIDAERILRKRLSERDAGSVRRDHRTTLGDWCATWLDTHVEAKAIGTKIRYRDITERVIVPELGRVKLADLDDVELARFKATLIRRGYTKRGADSILDVLSAALGQAVRSKVISYNPRPGVARERVARRTIDPPTREEADAMLAAVADDRVWFALYGLTIGHGLRQSEVLGLRRGDRSSDGLTLTIVRKREYRTGNLDEEPKDGSVRVLTLKPWLAEALDALGPGSAESLLFPGHRDPARPLDPHTLLMHVHDLSLRLGLRRRYTWHDLRRAFGTRISRGNSVAAITAAMGHRDYRTSLLYIAPGELVDDLEPPVTGTLRDTNRDTTSARRATR
jgi:integrase